MESVRIDRPKRTVPSPVDAFLEDRGDKKVSPSLHTATLCCRTQPGHGSSVWILIARQLSKET